MDDRTLKITITPARTESEFEAARQLFIEYAESLGFSLCFQNFDCELKELQLKYGPPEGELLLALSGSGEYVGVVGLRRLDTYVCEMKRLYVKPKARGYRIGHQLVAALIATAKTLDYRKMRLDTIRHQMQSAVTLYRKFGFAEIPAYYHNPMEGVLYMELDLTEVGPVE
jgi:ribosomal protein S18 acetylase RimI-like enzyme